jgi:hypothetical protein
VRHPAGAWAVVGTYRALDPARLDVDADFHHPAHRHWSGPPRHSADYADLLVLNGASRSHLRRMVEAVVAPRS